ncbi:hypothetical protein [Kineothrix sedimenti]|uniref:Uncharacterized protein n=1 Tax=Kineothrix sedimenti TaxID=3123317 RepID=A0ABZ3EX68_9FIRM
MEITVDKELTDKKGVILQTKDTVIGPLSNLKEGINRIKVWG